MCEREFNVSLLAVDNTRRDATQCSNMCSTDYREIENTERSEFRLHSFNDVDNTPVDITPINECDNIPSDVCSEDDSVSIIEIGETGYCNVNDEYNEENTNSDRDNMSEHCADLCENDDSEFDIHDADDTNDVHIFLKYLSIQFMYDIFLFYLKLTEIHST